MSYNQKKDKIIRCLNRAFKYTKIKQRLEREYKQKLKEMDSISVSYGEIKGNKINSKVEDKALELVKCKKDIDLYNIKIVKARKEIELAINTLEDETLKSLLRLRYLELKKWEDIAYIMGYSNKYIFKIHNKSLLEVDKYIKK